MLVGQLRFASKRLFLTLGAVVATACVAIAAGFLFDPIRFYPPVYFGFFASLVILIFLLSGSRTGRRAIAAAKLLSTFLERRGAICSDRLAEVPKFAIIRMLFGAFLVQRAVYIAIYSFDADWADPALLTFLILGLLAPVLVLIGFLTQFAFVYLILFQWKLGDLVLATSTLGNAIAAMLVVVLMVANAGAHFSIDGLLRRKINRLGKLVSWTYSRSGLPTTADLQVVKFAALFAYACVCLYSLSMHLNEPAWMNGVAGPQLLSSNFMSRYFDQFVRLFAASELAVQCARVSLWLMMVWYASIIPFVLLGGWLRTYIIVWGTLFFGLSTFVLQLGWLGEFEFLLWLSIFWRRSFIENQKSMAVLYDDRCNLCDRTVNFLLRVDVFHRIDLRPLSKSRDFLHDHAIEYDAAMIDLYCVDKQSGSRHVAGYDLYLLLTRRLLLLTPLFPILWLGKIFGVGPAIYAWIAQRRTKLFGVCKLPTAKPQLLGTIGKAIERPGSSRFTLAVVTHIFLLGVIYLATMPAPYLGWSGLPLPGLIRPIADNLTKAAYFYGIIPIHVFNSVDLEMSENWFTLSAVDTKGNEDILPLIDINGSRLIWHRSDRVYFGHTLQWRRGAIGKGGCLYDEYANKLVRFFRLYEREGKRPASYVYRQYQQRLADAELLVGGKYLIGHTNLVCTRDIAVDADAASRYGSILQR